jgi:4-aminobutyrate aminotransferase-like enzyme
MLNTLRRTEADGLEERVRSAGEKLAALLADALKGYRTVRDVRCFGLLVGIELNVSGVWKSFRPALPQLYLLALMQHRPFPVVAGYCQYEPNVLKLTPSLSITDEEISRLASALKAVLSIAPFRLASSTLAQSWSKLLPRKSPRPVGSLS